MLKAAALACFALITLGGQAAAEHHEGMDQAASMEAWQQYMVPGEPHQKMEYFVGEWTVVSTNYMMGPDQPQVSEGTMTAEMMMGGRFLKSWTDSEMMGMPFTGMSISGHDNATGEHWNIWLDNMGTGVMHSRGGYDDGNVVVSGTWKDPMQGDVAYRMITRITGDDTYEFDMFMGKGEEEARVMLVKYTRVKSS